jgi:plasmid maintenance system antidote protein VapI
MTKAQLQKVLDKLDMTPPAMAKLLGIDRRTVLRYVKGDFPIPEVIAIAVTCIAEHGDGTARPKSDK